MIKTYRYKLRLNNNQIERFDKWIGACRYIYNLAKECKETAFQKGVNLSYYDLKKQLPALKSEVWISDVQSQVLQDVIKRLDLSFQAFFNGKGYPKWAKKDKYSSLTFTQGVRVEGNTIRLPKIGNIRFFNSRPIQGEIKQARIKKCSDGWYISMTFNQEQSHLNSNEKQVGIDVGIARYYTLSNGQFTANPRFFNQFKDRLAEEQRQLSTKKLHSKNWIKQHRRVNVLFMKMSRKRRDFQHQLSSRLTKEFGLIVMEDLQIIKMSHNRKSRSLNRSLYDVSHREFSRQIEYKSLWNGIDFTRVNPKNTSRECPICGHVSKENRKSQSLFLCVVCNFTGNADHVGAVNILGRAVPNYLKVSAFDSSEIDKNLIRVSKAKIELAKYEAEREQLREQHKL